MGVTFNPIVGFTIVIYHSKALNECLKLASELNITIEFHCLMFQILVFLVKTTIFSDFWFFHIFSQIVVHFLLESLILRICSYVIWRPGRHLLY